MAPKRAWFVILYTFAVAAPAVAQETTGTISGTLGLDEANWYVTSGNGERSSGWSRVGNEVEATLVGQVTRDASARTEGALTVSLRTDGNPTELNVSQFTISYTPEDGTDGADYSADGANADLNLETLVISDDEMVVAGSFAGKLIQGGADDLVVVEDMPSVTIDGNFQATLPSSPSD